MSISVSLQIRSLTEDDFAVADQVFNRAFGRMDSLIDEMGFIQALQPGGRFMALEDGKPVGWIQIRTLDAAHAPRRGCTPWPARFAVCARRSRNWLTRGLGCDI